MSTSVRARGRAPGGGIVVVLSGFPRRSETFALPELTALDRAGLLRAVFATKPGDGRSPQPDAEALAGRVQVLPDGDADTQGAIIAAALGQVPPMAVHGYFAHHPAAVAERAALRLGVPYGFSVHARDARVVPETTLRRRARDARCVVTCNTDVHEALTNVGAAPALVPHGVDLRRFTAAPRAAGHVMRILAVGRLVRKKGFHVLLHALASLEGEWTLRVVGDGPEAATLQALARELGIAARVHWHGGCSHAELPDLFRDAQVVVAPSVVDESGDRDGLPNVVLEAMASERPVIATWVGAIESAVIDGETGVLVAPDDAAALTRALDFAARRPDAAHALARRARRLVEQRYDVNACARRFVNTLSEAYV